MKTYWSIPGPSKAPRSSCIAFNKYDGSNIRSEWTPKRGWYKFGTKKRLFDETDQEYGRSIGIFQQTLAEGLERVFRDNKQYRSIEKATVFAEFFGPSSFAGWHDFTEQFELVLIDVEIHKKGFVLPRDFVQDFGHLKSAPVIYEGNFSKEFVRDVLEGKYPVYEGVVAKGIIHGKKSSDQHGLWYAKAKTQQWLDDLKKKAELIPQFKQILIENELEQIEVIE